jgi:hypothetical protein
MRKLLATLVCVTSMVGVRCGGASTDIESALQRYFSNAGSSRMSGEGTFIHHTFQKAVDVGEFTKGIEFKDEQHKASTIRLIAMSTGLDFSLKEDKNTWSVEKHCYDNDRARMDVAVISREQAEAIKAGGIPNDLKFNITAFNGSRTIQLTSEPGGATSATVYAQRPYMPSFKAFGLNDSGKDSSVFLDAMRTGQYTITGSKKDGRIHAELGLKNMGMKCKLELDPSKGMALLSGKLYVGKTLVSETIAENYSRDKAGEWFPQTYISRKFAVVAGELVTTYEEKYEVIGDSVEFNLPVSKERFAPVIADGTVVEDFRFKQPVELVVNRKPDAPVLAESAGTTGGAPGGAKARAAVAMQTTSDERSDPNPTPGDKWERQRVLEREAARQRTRNLFVVALVGALIGVSFVAWKIRRDKRRAATKQ